MTEHGGDLDRAIAHFGGARSDWIDLSTGINPHSYPLPALAADAWTALPDKQSYHQLQMAAQSAYQTQQSCLPLAGAQQAIQLYPELLANMLDGRKAALLHPSYNEHEIQLRQAGWQIQHANGPEDMAGADLAVIVNPNNPDGRQFTPQALRALSEKVGFLVVDESFGDEMPHQSLAPHLTATDTQILVLRSFGKFFGLAGLRLGFAIGTDDLLNRIAKKAGSWAVSGPALSIGTAALNDRSWAITMRDKLAQDAARLDRLASAAGWHIIGGTTLFRLYEVGDSIAAQDRLASHHIWSRRFGYAPTWLRLGLPPERGWERLENALRR